MGHLLNRERKISKRMIFIVTIFEFYEINGWDEITIYIH